MTSIIKVDNIQHSSGTNALTTDSNGVVSRSLVPAFFLTLGTSADSRTATTEAAIPFAVQSDSGSNSTYIQGSMTVSNGVVTVPKTGLYYFNAVARFDTVVQGNWARLGLSTDGETLFNSANTYQSLRLNPSVLGVTYGAYEPLCVSAVLKLNANQTIEARASVYTDTTWSISAYDSHFTGYFIG